MLKMLKTLLSSAVTRTRFKRLFWKIIFIHFLTNIFGKSLYEEFTFRKNLPEMKGEQYKMAKKKSGSIAIPFLVTIFLGLLIVGGGAYAIYRYFGFGGNEKPKEPTPQVALYVPTEEDSHTMLLMLDSAEAPDKKSSVTFVLLRSIPVKKKVVLIGVPSNTIIYDSEQGRQLKLREEYDNGGPAAAKSFVEKTFGVTVDRYIKFDSEAFRKACTILGLVSYRVDIDIAGLNSGTLQKLNEEQIERYITYSLFDGGEETRAWVAASITESMLNQTDGLRIADQLDSYFDTIVDMTTNDINVVDKNNYTKAIKYLFENGSGMATCFKLDRASGDSATSQDFRPSQGTIDYIVRQYFTEDAEQ